MKKLALLLCLLILLLTSVGAVSAGKPQPEYITINGYITGGDLRPLPNGRMWFSAKAQGDVVGFVNGSSLTGTFTFDEEGQGDIDFASFTGSGKNHGVVTIFDADNKLFLEFEFNGKFDSDRPETESVWGTWKSKGRDLKGHGKYTGNVGWVFSVRFTGKFKD